MNKKLAFAIIVALIVIYCAVSYTEIPYKGVISLLIILAIAVIISRVYKRKDRK